MSEASQGWQCPQCGRVYAPWVRECSTLHVRVPPWPRPVTPDHVPTIQPPLDTGTRGPEVSWQVSSSTSRTALTEGEQE